MTVISPVRCLAGAAVVASVVWGMPLAAAAQSPNETVKAAPVERLGPNVVRIGNVHVDTAKQEVSVKGVVNDVEILSSSPIPRVAPRPTRAPSNSIPMRSTSTWG
jgi:hypothetical protein